MCCRCRIRNILYVNNVKKEKSNFNNGQNSFVKCSNIAQKEENHYYLHHHRDRHLNITF